MNAQVIPAKIHGAIDYVAAPVVAAAPDVLHRNGTRAASVAAVPRALLTAVTRRRRSRRRAAIEALRSPKLLIPAGTVAVAALVVAVGWSRRYRLLALFADAVEEVADTVEDAAEDVAAAARAREGEGAASAG